MVTHYFARFIKRVFGRWSVKFVLCPPLIGLLVGLSALSLLPRQAGGGVAVVVENVRVGLARQVPVQEFSTAGGYRVVEAVTGTELAVLTPGEKWQAVFADGKIELFKNGSSVGTYNHPLSVREVKQNVAILSGQGAIVNVASGEGITARGAGGRVETLHPDLGKYEVLSSGGQTTLKAVSGQNLVLLANGGTVNRYRGNIELRPYADGITVINELPLEQYLYGVVPVEMPAHWPEEALKAQVVAARNYALAQIAAGTYNSYGFDLMANQQSQVYRGYDAENQLVSRLVDSTRGQVMTCRDKIINAFFHSSSGGYTENSEDVWRDSLDYIRGKPDLADHNDKHYNWVVAYDQFQLLNQLSQKGYKYGKIMDIQEVARTKSGARVQKIVVTGLDPDGQPLKTEIYNADNVRIALGLKSSLFIMSKEEDPQNGLVRVTFTGSGWGHGLGMSQYGALGMAKQGYNYQEILKYYYNGVIIQPLTGEGQ